jgi:2-hydroxy-3-keto-5-methylthiopentenyl-1-phosphate phosphatase
MTLKLFVDFDGTITTRDVGNAFFRRYVGTERYNGFLKEYLGERISAQECFRRGVEAMGTINRAEAEEFVGAQSIDPTFRDCVAYCRDRQIEFHIVSDGLDFYIDLLLAANGFTGISVFSNKLEWRPVAGGVLSEPHVSFPYADAGCTRCACCKRNIVTTHAGDDDLIVYVGNGYSDRCPARYADIVFAKDSLQTFCQEQNISYFEFKSFADVVARLQELEKKKRLRKRLSAEQMRRELFMREP